MTKSRQINPSQVPRAKGSLYSVVGVAPGSKCYHISGQLALNASGEIVGLDDFAKQFAQVFANLKLVLDGLNLDFGSVVKFNYFLTRNEDVPTFMQLRNGLFPKLFPDGHYPAATLLVVSGLVHPELRLEVEAIAADQDA